MTQFEKCCESPETMARFITFCMRTFAKSVLIDAETSMENVLNYPDKMAESIVADLLEPYGDGVAFHD